MVNGASLIIHTQQQEQHTVSIVGGFITVYVL